MRRGSRCSDISKSQLFCISPFVFGTNPMLLEDLEFVEIPFQYIQTLDSNKISLKIDLVDQICNLRKVRKFKGEPIVTFDPAYVALMLRQ